MNIKLPFGLKDGVLVEVSQVERGLDCGCYCPSCHQPLIARKGNKSIHHFAHYNTQECSAALETTIHKAAKQILEKHKKIKIPSVKTKIGAALGDEITLFEEQTVNFDKVYTESLLDNIVPDVIVEYNNRTLIIEIAVTHPVDEEKRKKIEDNKHSAIEVKLPNEQINFKNLSKFLINETENKHWVHNVKKNTFHKEIDSLVDEYGRSLKITERKYKLPLLSYSMYGTTSHIDHCPLNVRFYNGKPYANFKDCVQCNYLFKDYHPNYIICAGHIKDSIQKTVNQYNPNLILSH
jgi:hypothetical protein